MIQTVIKRSGESEPFNHEKLEKWAKYASKHCGDDVWKYIIDSLHTRLPSTATSSEIHQAMITVCLEKKELLYSRVAARLLYAELRKAMQRHLGVDDRSEFSAIYQALLNSGVWCRETMPEYDPVFAEWYHTLYEQRFEYWQIKQHVDKYSRKIDDEAVETPHLMALGIGLGAYGNSEKAFEVAEAIVSGKLNLPTPVLNGIRNGDFDTISCCVITGGDTVDSIGVAEHIAYKMTAKKAGIGIELDTRSIGSKVKGGAVKHLGKQPIYATVDRAVKMFTQVSRGGSATVTYKCIDPDIEALILLKSQRTPENLRLDKLDYSFAYCDAFVHAVQHNLPWFLFDLKECPEAHEAIYESHTVYGDFKQLAESHKHKVINARTLLKLFLQTRLETGRVYCINLTRANRHTPFFDTIRLSNLCQEICLPTKPYLGMADLYGNQSEGETAFCSLAAVNVAKCEDFNDHMRVAEIALRLVDLLIDKAPMMTKSMELNIRKRRSVGIGITGLAGLLYKFNMDYSDDPSTLSTIQMVAYAHYFALLRASVRLVEEGAEPCEGVNFNWLPTDTMVNQLTFEPYGGLDLEQFRGKPRRNSVLVAHMPTESSAVFSDATNGLYPVRNRVVSKLSRTGYVQYIAPQGNYKLAWEIPNEVLARVYSIIQDFTDQAISADYYVDFEKLPDGKIPLSRLMREFVIQARLGIKTMYYQNTNDYTGGSIQDLLKQEDEEGCESCKL